MNTSFCLSLASNLRCFGFTRGQLVALTIPPAIEAIISLLFIYLYSGPGSWAQVLLAADSIFYFVWALLDALSHLIPAVHTSFPLFRILNLLVGAASFTTILFYSFYLYRLSFRYFTPTLPRKLQPFLDVLIPVLLVLAIAINEVSTFVGSYLGTTPNQPVVVLFPHDSKSLWFALTRSSLATYTLIQSLFLLFVLARLSKAFLEQWRIKLTHSDEHHYFNGIAWIAIGVAIGVAETSTGFARVTFIVVLIRRILRLVARFTLMFGLLKGLDMTDNFENLTQELRGASRISTRISRLLGINPQRGTFCRISHSNSEQSRVEDTPSARRRQDERVTVHYEKGQAPFLQIRFSTLDFPAQDVLADVQRKRRSLPGLISGQTDAGFDQHGEKDGSDETGATWDAALGVPRAKSELMTSGSHHSDWIRPPEKIRPRLGSGGSISDNLSVVRDLERKFTSLPPRVTGKYRGSILGQDYEEDPFPVVGISRQPSLRHDVAPHTLSEEGGASVTLTSSGSIKRKPAPPLLDTINYERDRRQHLAPTWGGLSPGVEYPLESPISISKDATLSSDMTLAGEPSTPSTPRSRKTTARNVLKKAGRALSDVSIRSAEWLTSTNSPRTARTPVTMTDIEMYRRLGPGTARLTGDALSRDNLPRQSRRSADEVRVHSKPGRPRSVGT